MFKKLYVYTLQMKHTTPRMSASAKKVMADRLYQGRLAAMNTSETVSSASPLSELWLDGSPKKSVSPSARRSVSPMARRSVSPSSARRSVSPSARRSVSPMARKSVSPSSARRSVSPSSARKSVSPMASPSMSVRRSPRKSPSPLTRKRKKSASPAAASAAQLSPRARAAQRIAGLPSPQRKALMARIATFKARRNSPSQSPPTARMRLGLSEPSPGPSPHFQPRVGEDFSVDDVTGQFDRARDAVRTQQQAKRTAAKKVKTQTVVKGYDYVAATDQVYLASAVRPHPDVVEHYVVLTSFKGQPKTHNIDVQYEQEVKPSLYTITVDGKVYSNTPLFTSENDSTPLKVPLHKMKQVLREQTLRNFVLAHIKRQQ